MNQGSGLINNQYYDSIIEKINNCTTCEDLQEATAGALSVIQAEQKAIQDQLTALAPILALLDPPTSPSSVITWVTDFITSYLTPMVKPSLNYSLQLAQIAQKTAELTSAINSASERIGSCEISIPNASSDANP